LFYFDLAGTRTRDQNFISIMQNLQQESGFKSNQLFR